MNGNKTLRKIKATGYYIVFFPGIFLHELCHAAMAIGTGSRITGFTFFPTARDKSIVFASVSTLSRGRIASFLIAMAPVILWGIAAAILLRYGIIEAKSDGWTFNYGKFLEPKMYAIDYALWQLYVGGFPSGQDLKVALRAILP